MDDLRNFSDIIAGDFIKIRKDFEKRSKNKGFEFDEDLFSDAFISCNFTLKNKLLTKDDALKYFWIAYLNKLKSQSLHPTIFLEDLFPQTKEVMNYEEYDIIDESYSNDIDILYDYIMDKLREKFGVEETNIFELHVCKGIHTKELEAIGYKDVNFVYLVKKFKRYIKNHIIKDNGYIKGLLKGIYS